MKSKYKKLASKKVQKVMHEWKAGTLNSGSADGPKVASRKQALAIALDSASRAVKKAKSRARK